MTSGVLAFRIVNRFHGSGSDRQPPNKRLKLTARVDYGMNLSSARRSLSAIRYAAHYLKQNLWLVH